MVYQLKDTVYFRDVYLVVGNRREFRNYLMYEWGEKVVIPRYAQWATFKIEGRSSDGPGGTLAYFIWMNKWAGTPSDHGALAHECYHATRYVFRELEIEDEEATAYYLDAMVAQFTKALQQ